MSGLTVPLTVRLKTARADRHVTHDVHDLTFRTTVPGGYASASIALNRPLTLLPDEIDYYASLYVYDGRSGATVWEGRVEDLGRSAGRDGQVWDINAVGPSAHTRDRAIPVIYVDRDLTGWQPFDAPFAMGGSVNVVDDTTVYPNGPALHLQWDRGNVLGTSPHVSRIHLKIRRAGQRLARVDYGWDAGRTSASLRIHSFAWNSSGGWTSVRDEASNTAGGALSPKVIGTDWATDRDALEVRMEWTGGTPQTIGDDVTWISIGELVSLGSRYDKAGNHLLTGASYTANTVLASDVVADLLGRVLVAYDGANASIATTSYGIQQLAYPDGVTPAKILDDLMTLEPAYYWAAWESNTAGKYRFEWAQWPTTVRYEADVVDGLDSPGSAADLYNAARVRYRDINGEIRTVQRTQTVAALTAAGLTREAFIDLGDEVGTAANANQVGDQFLAQHQYPPNAGRLRVARRILDRVTGRMVEPWEVKPGTLIRVRGVLPRVDALNATARDGVTVFRVKTVDYSTRDAAATLDLDSYPLSVSQALAALQQYQPSTGQVRRR